MEYEKRKKFIVNFLYVALIALIIYFIVKYGLGLITPFIFAFIIAYLLNKPSRFVSSKLKLPYKLVSIFFILLFYSTIGVLISLLGIRLFTFCTDFFSRLPDVYSEYVAPVLTVLFDRIEQAVYRMDPALVTTLNDLFSQFVKSLGDFNSSLSMKVVGTVSNYASALPGLFIKLLLMVISSFFIAGDYDKLTGFVIRQFPEKGRDLILHIKEYIVGTLFVCIRSYALIMGITFVELSIGLTIIGVPNSIIIAFTIAVFDILPVLGTGGIMIPWMIITAIQGNYPLAAGLLIVYLTVTVIRNIIEPKIVGSQIGLHPVVTLISMFVGAQLFGVIGLFGLPITLSLLSHLNNTGIIKLFKQTV